MTDVAVTGIGVVSPLGVGREAFWENCKAARSGLKRISSFAPQAQASNVAGLVEDFEPSRFLPPRAYRRMSRISRMAVAASVEALQDCGVDLEGIRKERVGVVLGTAYGSSTHVEDFFVSLLQEGPRGAQPLLFPETVPNAPASHIAMYHGITGPNSTLCQNEISAENALLFGVNLLAQGQAEVVLAGGAEEFSEMLFSCHEAVGILNPVRTSGDRPPLPLPGGGIVLGEGAAVLVMEPLDRARERGASVYGVLTGGAVSGGSAALGGYEEEALGLLRAVQSALAQAGVRSADIDQVHVSADFSGAAERLEWNALRLLYGEEARQKSVTPLKYLTGDFGGAGALRAACALLSLSRKEAAPSIRAAELTRRAPGPIPWSFRGGGTYRNALITSTTCGGGAAALIFSRQDAP